MSDGGSSFPDIVELNVGGVFYTTALSTLVKDEDSLLGKMFSGASKPAAIKDAKGRYFLDRDGVLFRYILDYLRNQKLVLPENFHEKERLKAEAEYFQLPTMVQSISDLTTTSHVNKVTVNNSSGLIPSPDNQVTSSSVVGGCGARESGYLTLGYRGTFAFGRDGLADVKFRKLSRLLVCGRVSLCREAFGDTLNESRDPDRGSGDRYSQRFFLKHSFLEQAFDMLNVAGFRCVGVCGSGTNSAGEIKPGMDSEENKWNHYNEFVFYRA